VSESKGLTLLYARTTVYNMTRKPPKAVGLTEEKVRAALTLAGGSPTEAARLLGVGRQAVIYWIRTRNIVIERVVKPAA